MKTLTHLTEQEQRDEMKKREMKARRCNGNRFSTSICFLVCIHRDKRGTTTKSSYLGYLEIRV
ncbi:unnamed protein product [Camellia sinensis]